MPILGLVITLEDASKAGRGRVLDRLLRERDVTIGDFEAGKLPVVLDVDGSPNAEPRVRELAAIEGVAHVDVVFSHFEDVSAAPEALADESTGESPWS
jgi:nitrate reductase NapAB chaperone NapD